MDYDLLARSLIMGALGLTVACSALERDKSGEGGPSAAGAPHSSAGTSGSFGAHGGGAPVSQGGTLGEAAGAAATSAGLAESGQSGVGGGLEMGGPGGRADSAAAGGAISSDNGGAAGAVAGSVGMAGAATGGTSAGGAAGFGSSNACPVKLEGWASVNDGTTGGGNATPTTVTTFAELKAAVQDSKPRVVVIKGTIKTTDGGGSALAISSNKTLVGADKNATIYGGVSLSSVSNVIIRNLNVQGTWPSSGPDDTIASRGSHHIWYDHLNIWDSTDGSLDITNASTYQTVSWTKFWYTSKSHPHRLASLNGSGGGDHPEDWGNEKVTYHHNWWSTNVNERMPRVMYGMGHQYNNYFNSPGNLYCIGVGSYGSVLVENNYFKDVKGPHVFMYDVFMYITARGNVYDHTTGNQDNGKGGKGDATGQAFPVAAFTDATKYYGYTLDKAADVAAIVQKCAGPQ